MQPKRPIRKAATLVLAVTALAGCRATAAESARRDIRKRLDDVAHFEEQYRATRGRFANTLELASEAGLARSLSGVGAVETGTDSFRLTMSQKSTDVSCVLVVAHQRGYTTVCTGGGASADTVLGR